MLCIAFQDRTHALAALTAQERELVVAARHRLRAERGDRGIELDKLERATSPIAGHRRFSR